MNSSQQLEFSRDGWSSLIADLRARGAGVRESGAFLLGQQGRNLRVVQSWVPYDDIDPEALSRGFVKIRTEAFGPLWALCKERRMSVVADVHTHPFGAAQSPSDRAHPMIGVPGHMALIVPSFASGDVRPADVSVNLYLGGGRWSSHFGTKAAAFLKLV